MSKSPEQPPRAPVGEIAEVLAHFAALRSTPEGERLYGALANAADWTRSLHRLIDRSTLEFAHALVRQYLRGEVHEAGTRMKALLLQQRLRARLDQVDAQLGGTALPEDLNQWEQHFASLLWNQTRITPQNLLPTAPAAEPAPVDDGELDHGLGNAHVGLEQWLVRATRTLTLAAVGQLDLAAQAKTLRLALTQLADAGDVDVLRTIIDAGTEELVAGHKQLATQLEGLNVQLSAVREQSQLLGQGLRSSQLSTQMDAATGLPNRQALLRRMRAELARAARADKCGAVALVEPVQSGVWARNRNTTPHAADDAVLRCYADRVFVRLRAYDVAARYDASGFALLLPEAGEPEVRQVLDKLKEQARAATYELAGRQLTIPSFISGVALFRAGDTPRVLLRRAQDALRRAHSTQHHVAVV